MNATELPLLTQPLDTATPVRQAEQDRQSSAINHEQVLGKYYENLNSREKSRLSSVISGAVQLEQFLNEDDLEGAHNFLVQRRSAIQNRIAQGENLDTEDTDAALKMIQSGNVDELVSSIQGLKAAGKVYGILNDSSGMGGATGELYNRWREENPKGNMNEFLKGLRGGYGQEGKNNADIATGDAANYATQSGKNRSDVETAGAKGYNQSSGQSAGTATIANNEILGSLSNMKFAIQQAKELVPQVATTGPIFGRAGNLAEDPQYKNLQGALNSITLQAKDLYNLGSGQGFTDADRDFLQEIVSGKYARAETMGLALNRLEAALQHREEFLTKQNQDYQRQYGGGSQQQQSPVYQQTSRIKIRDPKTGRTGTISADQAQAAQQQGYEVIQ